MYVRTYIVYSYNIYILYTYGVCYNMYVNVCSFQRLLDPSVGLRIFPHISADQEDAVEVIDEVWGLPIPSKRSHGYDKYGWHTNWLFI